MVAPSRCRSTTDPPVTGWLRRLASDGSGYSLAIPLSIASVALGLAREVLILSRLGLSARNDLLQYYLSVTFTVALFGDAMRLATANLLQRSSPTGLVAPIVGVALFMAATITGWFLWQGQDHSPALILMAGIAGAVNLVVVALLVRRQREGRFLASHVVAVMPAAIILVGMAGIWFMGEQGFVAGVVGLFLLAPVLQAVALLLMRPGTVPPVPPVDDAISWRRSMAPHAVAAGAQQAGQAIVRTALAGALPGTLALFALMARVTDSIRGIFLDTFIGSRLAGWAAGKTHIPEILDPTRARAMRFGVVTVLSAAGLAMTWNRPVSILLGAGFLLILGAGAMLLFSVRIALFASNARETPTALNWRLAAVDFATALVALFGWTFAKGYGPLLIWIVFVARPTLQLVILRGQQDS
jgi:hypothetical protein